MLHVAKLVLVNWMSFRGEHVLDLGPTAYGVFAHRTNDPESSNWSGKCLSGPTLVYDVELGPISIEEFCRRKRKRLVGYSGGRICAVGVRAHAKLGPKRMVRVGLKDGVFEEYGEDHPLLTTRGWVRAKALVVGDFVAKARSMPVEGKRTCSVAEAALVGCLLGDGVLDGKALKLCALREDKRKAFASLLRDVFPNHLPSMRHGVVSLVGKSRRHADSGVKAFREWAARMGLGMGLAASKRVPECVLRGDLPVVRSVLEHLWLTDGHVSSKTEEVSYTSASVGLAHDVRYLLLRLGLQSRLRRKVVDGVDYFTVCLTMASVRLFATLVKIPGEKGVLLQAVVSRGEASFKKPNVDVLPYEVWSAEPLKSLARLDGGKLRSISVWRSDRRGMSRDVFESFGGSSRVSRDVSWERVTVCEATGESKECWDVEVESRERVLPGGLAEQAPASRCRGLDLGG